MEEKRIYAGRTKIINFYKKFGITEDNKYPNLNINGKNLEKFLENFDFVESEVESGRKTLERIKKGKNL